MKQRAVQLCRGQCALGAVGDAHQVPLWQLCPVQPGAQLQVPVTGWQCPSFPQWQLSWQPGPNQPAGHTANTQRDRLQGDTLPPQQGLPPPPPVDTTASPSAEPPMLLGPGWVPSSELGGVRGSGFYLPSCAAEVTSVQTGPEGLKGQNPAHAAMPGARETCPELPAGCPSGQSRCPSSSQGAPFQLQAARAPAGSMPLGQHSPSWQRCPV